MVILSIALAIVAVIALSAFGLLLVLARRLRSVTERVNLFLPPTVMTLPHPGTPVPAFEAVSTSGQRLSDADFASGERIFALLTTGCGDCLATVAALREQGGRLDPLPVVGVVGAQEARAPIVESLAGHALVLEEAAFGPIATAWEINEFPAVLLVRDGYIRFAEHALPPVLAQLSAPAGAAR